MKKILNDICRKILTCLNKSPREIYLTEISKKINGSYYHICAIISELERIGLVDVNEGERDRRKSIVSLTPKGKEVAILSNKIMEILK